MIITVKLLIGLLYFISIPSFSEWSVKEGEKRGVVLPPDVRDVRQTLRPNFEHPRTLHLSPKLNIKHPEHCQISNYF